MVTPTRQPPFIGVAIILVAAFVFLAWPWISGAYTVPWDAKAHFQAQFDFLAASIGSGDSPFWNPYTFSGWPQVADPQSLIFVPAFLIIALFDSAPSFITMDATVFAMLGLGGIALAGFFRDKGWHAAGGTVAAISFAFGGSAAWRIQHTGQIISVAMLPIVLFLIHRALLRRSLGWGLTAGIAAGFLAIGRDQVALLSIYLLTAFVIAHLFGGNPIVRIGDGIKPLLGGIVGGIAIAAVPVTLTLILAQESNRPSIDYLGAGIASMHPVSFITLVNADLFGMRLHEPKVDFWGPPSEAFGVTLYIARNMAEIYAGMIPAFAILMWGLARGKLWDREIRVFSLALIVMALYTIGWYTPAFKWMFDYLPGVKLYRRPADATFLVSFLISIIGGYLVHWRLASGAGPAQFGQRIWQVVIAVLVLAVLPFLFAKHANHLVQAIQPSFETLIIWVTAIIAIRLALMVNRVSMLAAALILAAFTAGDLAFQIAPNESTAASAAQFDAMQFDTKDPTITFLKARVAADATSQVRDRVELAGLGFHWPNVSMIHKLENTLGYNPLRLKLYQDATGARDQIVVPEDRNFTAPLFPSYRSLMADMLGLRWIALRAPVETIDKRLQPGDLKLVSSDNRVWIYENPRALPRVAFVTEAKAADFDSILASGKWPEGFDPARTVLVDGQLTSPPQSALSSEPAADLTKAAAITSYGNTQVNIKVSSTTGGFVVLNDVYHRWWRADVDDAPTPIYRANVIFRTVKVPPGEHIVHFTFQPFVGALTDLTGGCPGPWCRSVQAP